MIRSCASRSSPIFRSFLVQPQKGTSLKFFSQLSSRKVFATPKIIQLRNTETLFSTTTKLKPTNSFQLSFLSSQSRSLFLQNIRKWIPKKFEAHFGGTTPSIVKGFSGLLLGTNLFHSQERENVVFAQNAVLGNGGQLKGDLVLTSSSKKVIVTQRANRFLRFIAYTVDMLIVAFLSQLPSVGLFLAFALMAGRDCVLQGGSLGKAIFGLQIVNKKTGEIASRKERLIRGLIQLGMAFTLVLLVVEFGRLVLFNERNGDVYQDLCVVKKYEYKAQGSSKQQQQPPNSSHSKDENPTQPRE